MNAVKTNNPRRFIIFAIVLAVILILVLLFAQAAIREIFVIPLSYLIWSVRVLVFILPEIYFWMAAIAIGVMIAVQAFGSRRKKMDALLGNKAELAFMEGSRGRVTFWESKVKLIRQGSSPYFQANFYAAISRLLLDMLAHRYRLSPAQVEDRLRLDPNSEQGRLLGLNVPDYVREYVITNLQRNTLEAKSVWDRLKETLNRFWRWAQAGFKPVQTDKEVNLDPIVERILKYMEEELEVPNADIGD